MYTCPAVLGVVTNLFCVLVVSRFFKESRVGVLKKTATTGEGFNREALRSEQTRPASFDRVAVGICVFSRFAQYFVWTNLGT